MFLVRKQTFEKNDYDSSYFFRNVVEHVLMTEGNGDLSAGGEVTATSSIT